MTPWLCDSVTPDKTNTKMSQLETGLWKQWGTCCDLHHQAVAFRTWENMWFSPHYQIIFYPFTELGLVDCLLALYLIRSGWNKTSWAVSWGLSCVRLLMFIRDGGKYQVSVSITERRGLRKVFLTNYRNEENCHYLYCEQDLIISDLTTNLQTFQTTGGRSRQ